MTIERLEQLVANGNAKLEKRQRSLERQQKKVDEVKNEIHDFITKGVVPEDYQDNYNYIFEETGDEMKARSWLANRLTYHFEYENSESKRIQRDIDELNNKIADYKKQIETEKQRISVPEIKEIRDFLDRFEAQVKDWCVYKVNRYNTLLKSAESKDNISKKYFANGGREKFTEEEYKIHYDIIEDTAKSFDDIPKWLLACCKHSYATEVYGFPYLYGSAIRLYDLHNPQFSYSECIIDESRLDKILEEDKKIKYINFINEILPITGRNITNVSWVTVGAKGELNGTITGNDGTAKVLTFSAGGYNIQCFHYRTRVTKLK